MPSETEAAFAELLSELSIIHGRLVEQLSNPEDEMTLLEAHKWILSILRVGSEVNLWADTDRPRFVEIVGPYKKWGGDNADAYYSFAPVDPTRTYVVTVEPGDAAYLSLTVYGGPNDGRYSERIVGSVNSRDAVRRPDGSIRIVLSAEQPDENDASWIKLEPDAVAMITRDYLHDPKIGRRAVWNVESRDAPDTYQQNDADLARRLKATTTWIREQAGMVPLQAGASNAIDPPYPVPTTTFGWAAGDAAYAMGAFELEDDQALVIRGRSPDCAFWNMCLWNPFLHTYNYDYERVTINGAQVHYEPDGSWTIVVAARRPSHPNWVSTAGHRKGHIWFRWFLPTETPAQPERRGRSGHRTMSDRPAAVRIDDLAQPRFSDEVRVILDFMAEEGSAMRLDPASLIGTAREETGLDDFGPADFEERLDVLCRAMREEGHFNDGGVMAQHSLLVGLLKNRLLLEDTVARHPEILDIEIAAPIVICGLPRTGTTHLHNLISADPAIRSLPYWESLEPLLSPQELPGPGEPDPRRARTEMGLSFLDAALPYFNRMHEMTVDHTHEEIQLLAIDFSTMLFETTAPMPMWRDYYLSHDQRPNYAYLRKILQVLQWARGGTRWVLKSPQHLEQFPALLDTFPDATFVVTHRDPVSVTASMVTMLAYTARLTSEVVDLEWIGSYWSDRLERMLRSCATDREFLPADRTIDVRFDEFMADDIAMVDRVYEIAGQPLSDAARRSMDAFMADHPRGRHGAVIYDLPEFGLDAASLRDSFSFYSERFGVAEEHL